MYTVTLYNFSGNCNAAKITRDLSTVTSCIGLSVRIVTKSLSTGSLLIFSIFQVSTKLNSGNKSETRSFRGKEKGNFTAWLKK
jgi:hypothetical protein